jgi:hypothetical protein
MRLFTFWWSFSRACPPPPIHNVENILFDKPRPQNRFNNIAQGGGGGGGNNHCYWGEGPINCLSQQFLHAIVGSKYRKLGFSCAWRIKLCILMRSVWCCCHYSKHLGWLKLAAAGHNHKPMLLIYKPLCHLRISRHCSTFYHLGNIINELTNSIGPRILPWGSPDVTGVHCNAAPSTTTLCRRLFK